MSRQRAGLQIEDGLWRIGYSAIAGLDEAGRGAWAGPVYAAAVILPPVAECLADLLGQVDDSKKLTPDTRVRLADLIRARAVAVGVGSVGAADIDRLGIASATRLAMMQAIAALSSAPDFLLIDFFTLPGVDLPQRGVPHGDALSLSIAAASIIAKVERDRWMTAQELQHRGYGFAAHKGYGTASHAAALNRLGPCPLHRISFRPVREAANGRI